MLQDKEVKKNDAKFWYCKYRKSTKGIHKKRKDNLITWVGDIEEKRRRCYLSSSPNLVIWQGNYQLQTSMA